MFQNRNQWRTCRWLKLKQTLRILRSAGATPPHLVPSRCTRTSMTSKQRWLTQQTRSLFSLSRIPELTWQLTRVASAKSKLQSLLARNVRTCTVKSRLIAQLLTQVNKINLAPIFCNSHNICHYDCFHCTCRVWKKQFKNGSLFCNKTKQNQTVQVWNKIKIKTFSRSSLTTKDECIPWSSSFLSAMVVFHGYFKLRWVLLWSQI